MEVDPVFAKRLAESLLNGMVSMDIPTRTATIHAPPSPESLSDDDWLAVLSAASEIGRELERYGWTVRY